MCGTFVLSHCITAQTFLSQRHVSETLLFLRFSKKYDNSCYERYVNEVGL